MFKKLNFKTLFLIFGILLGLVVVSQLLKMGNSDSNFNSQIVRVDTSKITAIYLKSKAIPDEIKIMRNGSRWNIVSKGKSLATDQQAILGMINEIAGIKAERVASSDKNEWSEYQVTDSTASIVKVEEEGKITSHIFIGKFSYIQNPQKFTTYVRLQGEDETYAVQGFLSMTFNRSINELLDKTVVNTNPANISRITFTYPGDSSFVLERSGASWKIGEAQTDSTRTAQFINTLANVTSYDIADETVPKYGQVYSVKIEGNNMKPVEIRALASDTLTKYVVVSDQNPQTNFAGGKGDLLSKIFASKMQFHSSKK